MIWLYEGIRSYFGSSLSTSQGPLSIVWVVMGRRGHGASWSITGNAAKAANAMTTRLNPTDYAAYRDLCPSKPPTTLNKNEKPPTMLNKNDKTHLMWWSRLKYQSFCKLKHNQSEETAGEVWDAIRLKARCRFTNTKSNGNMVEEVYFEAVGSYQ